MKMRSSKWFVLSAVIAIGGFAYHASAELRNWIKKHRFHIEGLHQALRSEVYLLETNRWLEFGVPADSPYARLVSNASIKANQPPKPGTQWPYAIEYQMIGPDEKMIATGVYHFKGEYVVFRDNTSDRTVQVNYFLDPELTPLSGGHWVLNFTEPGLRGVNLLRLRMHWRHPEINEVAVRLYFRKTVPQRKVGYLWNRLSTTQKRNLARGNVYSFEGLNAWEKACLLRYHWPAASPVGVPGHDFRRRTMYIRDDSEALQVVDEWVPAGIAIDEKHYALFALTYTGGFYLLEMLRYPPGPEQQVIANTLSWREWQSQSLQSIRITWSGTNYYVPITNRSGLLRVDTSASVYVRLLVVNGGVTNDVTPEPVHLIAFTCSPTNPVEYRVEHVDDSATLFLVDIRRRIEAGQVHTASTVNYELLGATGELLQSGGVLLTNTFTPYDWLHTREGLLDVTEPQSLYFVLPPTIRVVRITSPKETVLVNAYSRPSGLARKLRVPEDYLPGASVPALPAWFSIRPADQIRRREAGQACLVRVQPRLPELDRPVFVGEYQWDSFLPVQYTCGHMVLIPIGENRLLSHESLPFRYMPVGVGVDQRARFEAPQGKSHVEPSLILLGKNGVGGPVSVYLDGQLVFDSHLQGNIGEIRLGNVKPGEYVMRINANSALSAYLNYIDREGGMGYLKRFCVMVTSNVLHFPYLKMSAGAELLVLRVFSPANIAPEPYNVRVKLNVSSPRAIGPFSELTFPERDAVVTPVQTGRNALVPVEPVLLDEGQPVFVPVGSDLPPGQYEIEVHVNGTVPRWLSLSRTTPGLAEKLAVTIEPRL